MSPADSGLVHSVQARLVNHAHRTGQDAGVVFARYGLERFLYRLSRSPHGGAFVLKGAMLLLVWLGDAIRPTRDADLLGFGDVSADHLLRVFRDVCRLDVGPDGVHYAPESVAIAPIRRDTPYGGQRVRLVGLLGRARLAVQLDVGIGDAVTPAPEWLDYPSLLGLPQARLRAYRPATSIAEKLHAMVERGESNTRMKDFFGVAQLARQLAFDGAELAAAIHGTFTRRQTPLAATIPLALTPAFGLDPTRQRQWLAFVRKSRLTTADERFVTTIDDVARFAWPPLVAAARGATFAERWPAGGPWRAYADALIERGAN